MAKLDFPYRRTVNSELTYFFKIARIILYSERIVSTDPEIGYTDLLRSYEDYFENALNNFENELLQVIETTTQETINLYFEGLVRLLEAVNERSTLETIKYEIDKYNEAKLKSYTDKIEDKERKFLESGVRQKYGHLETYEVKNAHIVAGIGIFKFATKENINYHFLCNEEKVDFVDPLISEDYFNYASEFVGDFYAVAVPYINSFNNGEIKAKAYSTKELPPIIFFEGPLDIDYVKWAATLLDKNDILTQVALRHRSGHSGLNKLYTILVENNWETIPQKKMFLFDCDTNRSRENVGHIYTEIIPFQKDHPIKKGIENLFSADTIDKIMSQNIKFFDIINSTGTERGVPFERQAVNINKEEKRNFCEWMIKNGTTEDSKHFICVFEIIDQLISEKKDI